MAEERLQKILARAGIASRRKAEELITSGRVRVEGKIVTELGTKADTRAKIEVDGRRIEREQLCYGVFHKPRQMVTTLSDPEGRPTAQDVLRQVGVRVVPVGPTGQVVSSMSAGRIATGFDSLWVGVWPDALEEGALVRQPFSTPP